jgi:hypothetical protein
MILEDDASYLGLFDLWCKLALKELESEGLADQLSKSTIKQASSYSQAKSMLESGIDFASIDLALTKDEYRRTDQTRKEKGDPGGMRFLTEMQNAARPPLAVIVSGETLQSYGTDASAALGVLKFFQKSRLDKDEYVNAVKTALWYVHAADLTSALEGQRSDPDKVQAADAAWHESLRAAAKAGIPQKYFPENLGRQLEYIRKSMVHEHTDLPLGHWTHSELRKALTSEDWAILQATIEGFAQFVTHNSSQAPAILHVASNLLKDLSREFLGKDPFIGHLEHRTQARDPSFVIIVNKSSNALELLAGEIQKAFNSKSRLFARDSTQTSDELLPHIRTRIVGMKTHIYAMDLHELLDELGKPHR